MTSSVKIGQGGQSVKTVEVQDPAFGIVAFRMQIPANWHFEGILLRDPTCGLPPRIAFRASSPDGLTGMQELPQFGWHWSDDPSYLSSFRQNRCKVMMPMNAADFLKFVIPIVRPDSTIVRIEPTLDAAQWSSMIEQGNRNAQQMGLQQYQTGDAMRARLAYRFHDHPVEENFAARVTCTQQALFAFGGAAHSSWNCMASVTGFRAPQGELENAMQTFGPILNQGAMTNEWMQRVSQELAQDSALVMDAFRRQGEETAAMLKRNHEADMQQQRISVEKSQQIDRSRQQAMHRGALAYTLYAGDEQLVRNPDTGEVSRVTTQYGNTGWQDKTTGQIAMTDDVNFNPNLYLRGDWAHLESVNPLKP